MKTKYKITFKIVFIIILFFIYFMLANVSVNYFIKAIEVFIKMLNMVYINLYEQFAFKYTYFIKTPIPPYGIIAICTILFMLTGRKIIVKINHLLFKDSDINGTSRWATKRETKKCLVAIDKKLSNVKGYTGIILAEDKHNLYMDITTTNSLVIGTTRSGKGQMFVLPLIRSLAYSNQSMVINDPKGELLENSFELLKSKYKILILDFRNPLRSSYWNPLSKIIEEYVRVIETEYKDISKAVELVNELAHILTDNPKSDPIWPLAAKSLLSAIILFLLEDGYKRNTLDKLNMYSVYNFFLEFGSMKIDKDKTALDMFFENLEVGNPAKLAFATSNFSSGDMRSSIFSTLSSNLQIFSDSGIAMLTSKNEIDFCDLTYKEKPTAIFMIVADEKVSRHVLSSLFVNQCYSTLVDIAEHFPNQKLEQRVQFILDEFGNMKIPNMDTKITVSLGRNILFSLYIQSMSQLEAKYDKHTADTIQGNCGNLVYINSLHYETNEYISKLLANKTQEYKTYSGDTGDILDKGKTTHYQGRALMTADELQRMKFGECVVIKQRCYPIHTYITPFHKLKIPITRIDSINSDRDRFTLESVLYPFESLSAELLDTLDRKDNKNENINNDIQKIINQINLYTKKEFEIAVNNDDYDTAKLILDELVRNKKVSIKEHEQVLTYLKQL